MQDKFVSQAPASAADDSLRVLVVEDSVDGAKMSAMLLRYWGHNVRVAHEGRAALQQAQEFHPHIILLDIGLPDMDGYEVARLIRHRPELKGVCLIAITGYGQDTDRRRSREEGFDAHLAKPVETAELKELLIDFQSSVMRTRST